MGILDQFGLERDQISAALRGLKKDSGGADGADEDSEGLVLGREDQLESAGASAPDRRRTGVERPEVTGSLELAAAQRAAGLVKLGANDLPPGWRSVDVSGWNLQLLRAMDWKLFEELCAELFRREGYMVELTGDGADGGIDMLLRREGESESGGGVAVQCMRYHALDIELQQVREFCEAVSRTPFEEMIFVTTGNFNRRALEDFGSEEGVSLVDGEALLERILDLPEESAEALRQQVLADEGGWQTPTCPACLLKMEWRSPKPGRKHYKAFWGCPNYSKAGSDRCRETFNQARD